MRIAIVGGGITGLCCAYHLTRQQHRVDLFDDSNILDRTSSSSSKLLHGGLRYLENFDFLLVKEALEERKWWIDNCPEFAKPIELILPVYSNSERSLIMYRLGLFLYDILANKFQLGPTTLLNTNELLERSPNLSTNNLVGALSFYDGQMDETKLGQWVKDNIIPSVFKLYENSPVSTVTTDGYLKTNGLTYEYDLIINAAGPWSEQLLKQSDIESEYSLDLVRGSHIMIDREIQAGHLLEVPDSKRIFFVLPYKGQTLIGTTEARQTLDEPIEPSDEEVIYLIDAYNKYFPVITVNDIVSKFSGCRPLIKSKKNFSSASRTFKIEKNGQLINVFGGKWTTSMALAKKVTKIVNNHRRPNDD